MVIDLFLDTDDLMPLGIESDNYDSEGDIHFLKELLSNDTSPLPENKSFHFDHHDDPSFPRPPLEPPDVVIFFDLEPNTGVLIAKVVEDISEHHDKVFKPSIFYYLLISHRDKAILDFSESPTMMQYKFPLPVKDVPTARRLEIPLPGVYTAIEEMMKKLPVKDRWQLH
nr:hypothetical protein [Tanacetum cinerariifolium]